MVKLYKMIDGELVFVDYGIVNRSKDYELQGYYVRAITANCNRVIKPKVEEQKQIFIKGPSLFSRIKTVVQDIVDSLCLTPEPAFA